MELYWKLLCLWLFTRQWVLAQDPRPNTVRFELTLTWEEWAPAGIPREMILSNGQLPAPTLELRQGDNVEFLVNNQLPFSTTVHFHGIKQAGTPWSDGVPGLSQRPIEPGCQYLYKWKADQYGSYMYHAHRRGQIDDGLYGAIYIHPDESVKKPFPLITSDPVELAAIELAESATTPLVLSDWRKLTSEELWASEEADGYDSYCVNALLLNGKGSISCLSQEVLEDVLPPATKGLMGDNHMSDIGCFPPLEPVQGNYSHNPNAVPPSVFSGCTPSQGSQEVLAVHSATRYVSYDLINAAGTLVLAFSIDEHPMYVYAVDGRYVEPTLVDAIHLINGARYSVMVPLDKPAGDYTVRLAAYGLSQIINGTGVLSYSDPIQRPRKPSTPSITITGYNTTADTVFLDESTIVPFPVEVPSPDVVNTYILKLDHYGASYRWTLGNSSFPLSLEDDFPVLFDVSSAPQGLSVQTLNGTWVDIIFHVSKPLQPPHPIHKHSNKYFVIGQGQGEWNYSSVTDALQYIPESFNLEKPQLRDTFATPVAATGPSWLAIRYQVVNPGPFLLHCHVQIHLSGGMALALIDGVDAWPEVPDEYLYGSGF
ncbi:hypothetical protein MPDQ_006199 [Monascus purpureus]|uniref:Laccase, multicopper oxidase, benzenediol:oxygen oxidorectuctase n=1 Tax=Monascus purpureus TaxID=5098 RepID=A0A507QYX6_MONPU|nr:hypothetical protein MPDQ_006199 [Monascus purpureus]